MGNSPELHPIVSYLKDVVHDQVKRKLDLEAAAARDIPIAESLTSILTDLKRASNLESVNEIEKEFKEQALDIINSTNALLSPALGSTLFRRGHNWTNSKTKLNNYAYARSQGADDIAEVELAALFSVIEKRLTGQSFTIQKNLLGTSKGNIIGPDMKAEFVEGLSQGLQKAVAERGQNYIKEIIPSENSLISTPELKSIKTDVQGPYIVAKAELAANVNKRFVEFGEKISGRTFSLKNYSKSTVDNKYMGMKLGDTILNKSVMGSLQDLGYSIEDSAEIYFSALNRIDDSSISEHFYHLRFVYELTGAGLKDEYGNDISKVDFLVWNDPTSTTIKVISTADLILRMFNRATDQNALGRIILSKEYLK